MSQFQRQSAKGKELRKQFVLWLFHIINPGFVSKDYVSEYFTPVVNNEEVVKRYMDELADNNKLLKKSGNPDRYRLNSQTGRPEINNWNRIRFRIQYYTANLQLPDDRRKSLLALVRRLETFYQGDKDTHLLFATVWFIPALALVLLITLVISDPITAIIRL